MDPLPAELDLLPMAVMVVRDGLVRQVNRACLRLLEADVAQQVLGQSVERFLHPQDADLARQRREESARPGQALASPGPSVETGARPAPTSPICSALTSPCPKNSPPASCSKTSRLRWT